MPVETEIKIRLADPDGFRSRLTALPAVLLSPRHLEDNLVLDFPDGRLRERGCLMRVRFTRGIASVTFKGPPISSDLFKKREEWETRAADGSVLLRILGELGLAVWFRYQKYREEFACGTEAGAAGGLHIALDETPVGAYVELEGREQDILDAARRLGFRESEFIRDSYYGLYLRHCQEHGLAAADMVFAEGR